MFSRSGYSDWFFFVNESNQTKWIALNQTVYIFMNQMVCVRFGLNAQTDRFKQFNLKKKNPTWTLISKHSSSTPPPPFALTLTLSLFRVSPSGLTASLSQPHSLTAVTHAPSTASNRDSIFFSSLWQTLDCRSWSWFSHLVARRQLLISHPRSAVAIAPESRRK